MAHGFSFAELAKKDAICSEKVKKALDINSTYDEELKKGLSCLQKERRSLMNSLTKQKLDFVQKKCKLPSIHLTRSVPEKAEIQKKVAEFCCAAWSRNGDSKQRNGSPAMDARPVSQPSSKELKKLFREKSTLSDSASVVNEDGLLDQEKSFPQTAWPSKTPKDVEWNDFKPGTKLPKYENDSGRLTSPALDAVAPRSPTSPRFYRSHTLANEEIDLARCRSLPSSPRCGRRRANTLDTPRNLAQANSCNNLTKTAVERSQSTPLRGARSRTESTPVNFEVSLAGGV